MDYRRHPISMLISERLSEFLSDVDSRLTKHGFERTSRPQSGGDLCLWSRVSNWSSQFADFVSLSAVSAPANRARLVCDIGVESLYLAEVENECRLWECGMAMIDSSELPSQSPMPLFEIPMQWMIRYFGKDSDDRSWVIQDSESPTRAADSFWKAANELALPLFDRLSDLSIVKSILLDPGGLFGDHAVPGVLCQDPVNYCALAYAACGRREDALEQLANVLNGKNPPSIIVDLNRDSNYQSVLECRTRRVFKYVSKA